MVMLMEGYKQGRETLLFLLYGRNRAGRSGSNVAGSADLSISSTGSVPTQERRCTHLCASGEGSRVGHWQTNR